MLSVILNIDNEKYCLLKLGGFLNQEEEYVYMNFNGVYLVMYDRPVAVQLMKWLN